MDTSQRVNREESNPKALPKNLAKNINQNAKEQLASMTVKEKLSGGSAQLKTFGTPSTFWSGDSKDKTRSVRSTSSLKPQRLDFSSSTQDSLFSFLS